MNLFVADFSNRLLIFAAFFRRCSDTVGPRKISGRPHRCPGNDFNNGNPMKKFYVTAFVLLCGLLWLASCATPCNCG